MCNCKDGACHLNPRLVNLPYSQEEFEAIRTDFIAKYGEDISLDKHSAEESIDLLVNTICDLVARKKITFDDFFH